MHPHRTCWPALLLVASLTAGAKTFPVSPETPDGLASALDAVRAWRAAGATNEAATIRLERGIHRLTKPLALDGRDSGTAGFPLTIEAADPDDTVVSGGRAIGNWQAGTDGVWRATVEAGFRFEQLYVNGSRAIRARAPDRGFFKVEAMSAYPTNSRSAPVVFTVPVEAADGLPPDAEALQQTTMLFLHKWDTTRHRLATADAANRKITVEVHHMKPWNPLSKGTRFQLENYRAALTEPGEWFQERDGTVLYLPRPGERISRIAAVAPVVEKLLEVRGVSHLHFRGMRFHHAGYTLPPEGNRPAQAASYLEAAVMLDGASDVTFDRCEIAHTGLHGLWFRTGCRDSVVRHCLLEDLGAGALRIGDLKYPGTDAEATHGIVVEDCIVQSIGHVHPSACAMWIGQSADNRIVHCDIADTAYTGISVGWTWGYGRSAASNNFIGYNRIHRIGQGLLSDLGGLYTLGTGRGNRCVGNLFYDIRGHDYGGWGIYHDEGSTAWRSESNLVWNCTCVKPQGGAGFHQHYGRENVVANNVFADSSGAQLQASRIEDHLSFTLEHNLVVNTDALLIGGVGSAAGPWPKLRFESRSNAFYHAGSPSNFMAGMSFAGWQAAGHDAGSVLLEHLDVRGTWPDVEIRSSTALAATGFVPFDVSEAGVRGERAWRKRAAQAPAAVRGLVQPVP